MESTSSAPEVPFPASSTEQVLVTPLPETYYFDNRIVVVLNWTDADTNTLVLPTVSIPEPKWIHEFSEIFAFDAGVRARQVRMVKWTSSSMLMVMQLQLDFGDDVHTIVSRIFKINNQRRKMPAGVSVVSVTVPGGFTYTTWSENKNDASVSFVVVWCIVLSAALGAAVVMLVFFFLKMRRLHRAMLSMRLEENTQYRGAAIDCAECPGYVVPVDECLNEHASTENTQEHGADIRYVMCPGYMMPAGRLSDEHATTDNSQECENGTDYVIRSGRMMPMGGCLLEHTPGESTRVVFAV